MNLNDLRLNAYKNGAKKKLSSGKNESKNPSNLNQDFLSRLTKISTNSSSSQNPQSNNPSSQELYRGSSINTVFSKALGEYSDVDLSKKLAEQQKNIRKSWEQEQVQAAAQALKEGGLLKVPAQPPEADGKENVYRRVAKFLVLIGIDEAAKILPHLTEEQTEKIIPEIASIRHIDKFEADQILTEFKDLFERSRENGGVETARTILEKAFGSDKADALLNKTLPFKGGKPFDYLKESSPERVSQLLKGESSAVCALVLSYLNPKVSAKVISAMGDEDKKTVIMRLAKLKEMNPEVVRRVDEAMHEKMNRVAADSSTSLDGRNVLAQILKRMSPEGEESILNTLSDADPDLGADLRDRLFTIDDVIAADDRYIQSVLRKMTDNDIALLIAGKKEEFRKKILSDVSGNRAQMILDEEELRKPFRKVDCDKITSLFFSILRRAWEDGSLIIQGRDDEIYV